MIRRLPALSCIFIGAGLFCACTNDTGMNRQTVSGKTAVIYEPGGIKTAAAALVTIFNAGAIDGRIAALYRTDDRGEYSIEDLPSGEYAVWAESDSMVLFQDCVIVTPTFGTLRDDTLEPPSSLTLAIGIQPNHDIRTVTVLAMGTGKCLNAIDDDGWLTFKGMAGGVYRLFIRSLLPGYIPETRSVTIAAGSHDTMEDTIRLGYLGIPAVTGIRLVQDTLAGAFHLSWRKTTCGNFRDYVLYKDACSDINFSNRPFYMTTDTFFIDSINSPLHADSLTTTQPCYKYRVAARTVMHEIGPTYRYAAISFAPALSASTFFIHAVRYADPQFDSASINDTVACLLTARNPTRTLRSLTWYDPATMDTISTVSTGTAAVKELTDTVRHSFGAVGTQRLVAVLLDDAGTRWFDTIPIKIVIDAPVVNAGNDTGAFTEDTVRLHGDATQQFGTIAGWKWKIGADQWTTKAGPDTSIVLPPASEQTMVCSLAAIDDDGNRSVDEIKIVPSFRVRAVAAFDDHSLILKSDGSLCACGSNDYGQLGDGAVTNRCSLVRVMTDVQGMSAGYSHSLIWKKDGSLWACGNNDYGQLGDGTMIHRPTPIPAMTGVEKASAGYYHSLVLKTDGTLWAFGYNHYGQLGIGTTESQAKPVQVSTGVRSMAAGAYHSLILKNDESLWACGKNDAGQLGDGAKQHQTSPVRIMTGIQSISAGHSHSLILKKDGTLLACGNNSSGRLGDGTVEDRALPVAVKSDVQDMSSGFGHSLICGNDRTLWGCGYNEFGQLGDATTEDRPEPVMILTNVKSAAAGYGHSLIQAMDGALWVCGRNTSGELGDGSRENRTKPIRIIPFSTVRE